MLRATLRSLAAHKLRLLLSALSVVLGVAFVAGTLVFSDTLQATFDDLISQTTSDVVITPKVAFTDPTAYGTSGSSLPADLVGKVRSVPGVAKADGLVFVNGVTIIGSDGTAQGVVGAPNFGSSWVEDPDLTGLRLVSGRGPQTSSEVAIDNQSATSGRLKVGDQVTIARNGPTLRQKVVGIFRYGTSGNLAGASIVAFDTATAQRLFLAPDRFSQIGIMADPGVSQSALAARVAAVAPGTTIKTGAQSADEASKQVTEGLRFIDVFLLIFALVALFVGSFIILNTFSMIVAQRTRELALLRAVGASRRQVAGSVLAEAAVVGLFGGVAGLVLGLLLAKGLQVLFRAVGLDMPTVALVMHPRTVAWSLGLGLAVTMLAAYGPARRASRVPPVAAMREGTAAGLRTSPRRTWTGVAGLVAGLVLLAVAVRPGAASSGTVGIASLVLVASAVLLAPVLAGPAVRAIGVPFRRSVSMRIAVRNAGRNPRRTAATAAALMIGLALVGTFAVLGSSAKASTDAVIDQVLRADFVVTPKGIMPFSLDVARAIEPLPGVAVVSPMQIAPAQIGGQTVTLTGVDPATVSQVVGVTQVSGQVSALTADGLQVDDQLAKARGYRLGQAVAVTFLTGTRVLDIVGVYAAATGLSGYVVAGSTLTASGITRTDSALYIEADPDADLAAVRSAIQGVIAAYPTVKLQDQAQLKEQLRGQVDQALYLVYALLALAVLIAILGIVNTLALSVVERTREIGLLRAVGTARRQLRRLIRLESVVIALFGSALGIVLGLVLGVALQRALVDQGVDRLSVPWVLLLTVTALAALAGVLAAVWPARRAARLNVLQAVTSE